MKTKVAMKTNKRPTTQPSRQQTFLLITLIIAWFPTLAQNVSYLKTIKIETRQLCHSMVPMANGKFLICGQEQDTLPWGSNLSIFAAVIDNNASEVWHKTFKEYGRENGIKAVIGQDSSIYILGNYWQLCLYIIKISKNLEVIWEKRYEGTPYNYFIEANGNMDMIMTRDTNLVIVSPAGLLKVDTGGNILAKRIFMAPFGSSKLIETESGDLLIGGTGTASISPTSIIIQRLDKDFHLKWTKSYYSKGSMYSNLSKILEVTSNDYIILGGHYNNYSKGLFFRIDSTGTVLFSKFCQIGGYTFYSDIVPDNLGEYLILGWSNFLLSNAYSPFIQKVDHNGNTQWAKAMMGPYYFAMTTTNDGYLLYGRKFDGYGKEELCFAKIPFGNIGCNWGDVSPTAMIDSTAIITVQDVPETFDTNLNMMQVAPNFTSLSFIQADSLECLDSNWGMIVEKRQHEENRVKIFPNPFENGTTITWEQDKRELVLTTLHDLSGCLIKTVTDKTFDAGEHSVTWQGENREGNQCGSGIYFCVIKTRDAVFTGKMIKL